MTPTKREKTEAAEQMIQYSDGRIEKESWNLSVMHVADKSLRNISAICYLW